MIDNYTKQIIKKELQDLLKEDVKKILNRHFIDKDTIQIITSEIVTWTIMAIDNSLK